MNIDLYKLPPEAATTILRTTLKASPTDAGETIKELVQRASFKEIGGWAEFLTDEHLKSLFSAVAASASEPEKNDKGDLKPAPAAAKARTGGPPKATAKATAKKPAAKATAKKRPAKAKAANGNGAKEPPHLAKVMGAMKVGDYYQKAQIVEATGLSQAQFAATIGYMKEHKLVDMVGERGAARYYRPRAE